MKQLKAALALVLALVMVLCAWRLYSEQGNDLDCQVRQHYAPFRRIYFESFQQLFFCGFGAAADATENAESVKVKNLWKNNLDGKSLNDWITDKTKGRHSELILLFCRSLMNWDFLLTRPMRRSSIRKWKTTGLKARILTRRPVSPKTPSAYRWNRATVPA